MTVQVRLTVPKLDRKLARAKQHLDAVVLATLQTNRGMIFRREGAYNGRSKWAPLQLRSGQILARRGNLKRSLSPPNATGRPGPGGIARRRGNVLEVGTTLAYAAMMNWGTTGLPGGVLRPRRAKALAIPLPGGKMASPAAKDLRGSATRIGSQRVIFRAFVRIPARRFDDLTRQDGKEIAAALRGAVAMVLRG